MNNSNGLAITMTMAQLWNNLRVILDVEEGRTPRAPAVVVAAMGAERLAADCVARIEAEGYVVADLLKTWGPSL